MTDTAVELHTIVDFLNRRQCRATYTAVSELLGVPAVAVGALLGARNPRNSWVVRANDGLPSGYDEAEMHPMLRQCSAIYASGAELLAAIHEAAARPFRNPAFSICHADDSTFRGEGLRVFFEYRDLGIARASGGDFGAHVIRAVPGRRAEPHWHVHDLDFQMVYVLRGWVVFEYEGEGEHLLRAGSCVLQPPGIRHRELRHADDLELIEIVSPAVFDTEPA